MLYTLLTTQRTFCCTYARMSSEAFKRRLVHSATIAIAALKSLVPMLKSFIANVLKCKAFLKQSLNAYALLCVP